MTDSMFRMRLHLTSGRVVEFEQADEEAVRHNLPLIAPDAVFEKSLLVIAGAHRTTTYRTSEILRIEVESERIEWKFARQIKECELLDPATFETQLAERKDVPREAKRVAGARFDDLAEVQDVRGEITHVRIVGVMPPSAARKHLTETIAEGSYLYARRDATHVVFNTATLVSIALFPGPKEVPYDAVNAHHV